MSAGKAGPSPSPWDEAEPPDLAVLKLRQFTALLAHSTDAIVILDELGRICEWSPAAQALLGWSRQEILDAPARLLVPPDGVATFDRMWTSLTFGEVVPPFETVRLHRNGGRTMISLQVFRVDDDGRFAGAVAMLRDLSARYVPGPAESEGTQNSGQDAQSRLDVRDGDVLTGLWGRRGLQRRLAEPVAAGLTRAVALLDVDAFALVNQTYGPDAADEVLREVGRRLRVHAGSAIVGRWQADEFVCIVDAADPVAALDTLMLDLLAAVREPLAVGDDRLHLTVSAGLVTSEAAGDGDLIKAGTAALRAAKETGRDRAIWFNAALRPASGGGMRLANDLHRGIEADELRLLYQPILELRTDLIIGVEALVRWERPGVGLLGPAYFIDVAERTGQIVPLGAWVTQHACRAAVSLAESGAAPCSVGINLSARQLSDDGVVSMLREALRDSGCSPSDIIIEVTETALMHDMSAATLTLEAIKALGVSLVLDDFGTGYSSLLYLKKFPVDRIKIDQSFVRGLGSDADDTAIVASTIALAHSVGLKAVAEGVETTEQLALLRTMGCDFAQGFLLSGPLTLSELQTWLRGRLDVAEGEPSIAEERDQAGEERDHAGEQRDQAGEERDHAGDERDQAGDERDHAGEERDQAGDERDQAGDQRDQAAQERDQAADQRDQAADKRDQVAEESEASARVGEVPVALSPSALARREAAADRRRASQDRGAGATERTHAESDRNTSLADRGAGATERTHAESDRTTALADRGAGATERTYAELDRSTALADRGASARERESASVDDLTGVYRRAAGFIELEREMARARRTGETLVLAFVDVDGLKAVNDSSGHAAGDRLLLEVATTFKSQLRSHDVIIRYGGDEFVCVLSGLTLVETNARLGLVHAALADAPEHGSVTVGLAELEAEDSAETLVARADAALYQERQRRRRT